MIFLAAGALAALALVAVAALNTIGRMLRAQARERDLLINQVCSLAGKPWQPAPASVGDVETPEPLDERFETTPGQLPDFWPGDE